MGSCAGKNKTTTDSIANVKTESPALKNFKIQQSNLVKEKHTDINLDYTFLATLGQGLVNNLLIPHIIKEHMAK